MRIDIFTLFPDWFEWFRTQRHVTNALALSLRSTSEAELAEILDSWFAAEPSSEADDRANVERLADIESADL